MKTFLLFVLTLSGSLAFAGPFKNIDSIKKSLNFNSYYSQKNPSRPLKIAVLDKGFYGYEKQIGKTLPANTRYVAGPVTNPDGIRVEHGLKMAQILTSLMTNDLQAKQWMPELTLYNAFGYSNFKAAIDDVIANKVDLVLYSEVWEYGGNNDGQGFINAQVTRAARAGVLWVNAVGNFGRTTYNTRVRTGDDNWVALPDRNNALAIRCQPTQGKKCQVKIVLSWDDFKNDVEAGTKKDLDLALTDDLLNVIQSSALTQSSDRKESRPGYSKYPREIIAAELSPGLFYIRVKDRSNNLSDEDSLRITADGDGVSMPSNTPQETALNPADNPLVIAVGANDSDRSSSSLRMKKPDLMAPSSIVLQNDDEFRGSSNSAAIVAAGLALLKSAKPDMTREEMLRAVRVSYDWHIPGLSLTLLKFAPTGDRCFLEAKLNPTPDYVKNVLGKGGVPVQTTAGIRIMVPFDPIRIAPYLSRALANDMVVVTPQGRYDVYSRTATIPSGAVEIFQRPLESGLCAIPSLQRGKSFRLP
ncbi:Subtilase family protein [compost metagenome]